MKGFKQHFGTSVLLKLPLKDNYNWSFNFDSILDNPIGPPSIVVSSLSLLFSFIKLVIGPPGSGKSTFCFGMQQMLDSLGRNPVIINLDPANDQIPYPCDINITDLIKVDDVMQEFGLGPNGALLHCLDVLEANFDWLVTKLESFPDSYFVFDLPGQVEISTCHDALQEILRKLLKLNYRLTVVHLSDASYCIEPLKYISMLLITVKSMMQLGCPQVNVLSKIDLIESLGSLPLRLEYYTEVQDLRYLLAGLEGDHIGKRYHKLNSAICELVEELGLLSYIPLAVEDKECMAFLLGEIDKANGFVFGGLTAANESIIDAAISEAHRERLIELVKERYTSSVSNHFDE